MNVANNRNSTKEAQKQKNAIMGRARIDYERSSGQGEKKGGDDHGKKKNYLENRRR